MAVAEYTAVVGRPVFDGRRQHEALELLQKAAGIEATVAAMRVGLSYPQYNRYLWGKLPLRTDQIATFAAAYGVTKAEITRALGLMDDEPDPAIRRRFDEATAGLQVAESTAEYATRQIQRLDPAVQDDLLEQMAEAARADREP